MLHSTASKQNESKSIEFITSYTALAYRPIMLTTTKASRKYRPNDSTSIYLDDRSSLYYINPQPFPSRYMTSCFHAKDDTENPCSILKIVTTHEFYYQSNNQTNKQFSFLTQLNPTYSASFSHCSESKITGLEDTWENWSEIRIINTDKMKVTSVIQFNDRLATEGRCKIHGLNEKTFVVLCEALVSEAELIKAWPGNHKLKAVILPDKPSDAQSAKSHVVLDFYVHSGKGYERQATYILDQPNPVDAYHFLQLSATRLVIMTNKGKNMEMEMLPNGLLNTWRFDRIPLPLIALHSSINPDIFFSVHQDARGNIFQEWDTKNFTLQQTYYFNILTMDKLEFNGNTCLLQNYLCTYEATIPSLIAYLDDAFLQKTNLIQHLQVRALILLVFSYIKDSFTESLLSDLRVQSLFKTPDFKAEVLPLPEPQWFKPSAS